MNHLRKACKTALLAVSQGTLIGSAGLPPEARSVSVIRILIASSIALFGLTARADVESVLGIYTTMVLMPAADARIDLLDLAGAPLGPRVDELQFCDVAARGLAVIAGATYQVVGTGREPQVFCGRFYSRLHRKQPVAAGALGRARFAKVEWKYGLGAGTFKLVPWRTVAAASGLGRALYASTLRGLALPDGTTHDGHVLVADSREGAGVDLFVGLDADAPAAERLLSGILGKPTLFHDAPGASDAMRRAHQR